MLSNWFWYFSAFRMHLSLFFAYFSNSLARTNVAAIILLLIVQIEQVHSCKKPRAITQLYEQHLDMLFFLPSSALKKTKPDKWRFCLCKKWNFKCLKNINFSKIVDKRTYYQTLITVFRRQLWLKSSYWRMWIYIAWRIFVMRFNRVSTS